MVEVMKIMVTSFKRSHDALLHSVPRTLQQSTADPCLHNRPLDRKSDPDRVFQVWAYLLWDHGSFLLRPGAHRVLFVPSKSLFPQSCGSPIINTSGLQSQSWEFSVPLLDPQVGKSVVGPRTFLTV